MRPFSLSSRTTAPQRRSDEGQGQSTRPARAMGWCGAREQQGEERASHPIAAHSVLLDQARPAQRTSKRGTRGQTWHGTFVRALQGARTSLARPAPEPGLRAPMPSTSAHGEPEPRGSAATCNAWRTSTANLDCFLFRGASRRLRQEVTIKTSFRGTLAFFLLLRRRAFRLSSKSKRLRLFRYLCCFD